MSKDSFKVINIRVTFKNIPIHKIASFSFKDVTAACETFKKIPGISECVIVQTASRVEIFTVNSYEGDEVPDARRDEGKGLVLNKIKETWVSLTELEQYDIDHFDQILEVYINTDVYLHLLRLASGLDSIVVGNETILEELKASITTARHANVSGKILNRLFDTAIRIATRTRETTAISKGVVSIGNIAVKIAEDNAGLDAKKHVLILGTGETAAMVAKSLKKKGYPFDVSSMFTERATGFSKILGGKPVTFQEVISGFNKFDIIFVATTADYFILSYDKIRIVMESKKSGTMILDISDPRSVDENVSSLPGVKLMFRDQITEMEERNIKEKEDKILAVEKIISKEIAMIEATIQMLGPEPQVSEVFASVDALRKKELEKALQKLGDMDAEKIKIIDELTKTVVESIVSIPAKSTKKAAE